MASSSEPTFESIRKACGAESGYATDLESSVGTLSCQFKNKRKSSQLYFDFSDTAHRVVVEKWRDLAKKHEAYVQEAFNRGDWKEFVAKFRPETLCVDVLRDDAEEWFEEIFGRIQRQEGMTGVKGRG